MASRSWQFVKDICDSTTALFSSSRKADQKRKSSTAIPTIAARPPLCTSSSDPADSMARLDGAYALALPPFGTHDISILGDAENDAPAEATFDYGEFDHTGIHRSSSSQLCYDTDNIVDSDDEGALDDGDMLFMADLTRRSKVSVTDEMGDAPAEATFDYGEFDHTGIYRYSDKYPSNLYYDTDNIVDSDSEPDDDDMLFMPDLTRRSKMSGTDGAATNGQVVELLNSTVVSVKMGVAGGSFNAIDELTFDVQADAVMVSDSMLDAVLSPATPVLNASESDEDNVSKLSI